MKKMILAAMLAATALLGSAPAAAQVNRHEQKQERRIRHGEQSGALTPREAGKLEHQQMKIDRAEHRMRSRHQGRLTWRQRQRLQHRQARASRAIYMKKHNRTHY